MLNYYFFQKRNFYQYIFVHLFIYLILFIKTKQIIKKKKIKTPFLDLFPFFFFNFLQIHTHRATITCIPKSKNAQQLALEFGPPDSTNPKQHQIIEITTKTNINFFEKKDHNESNQALQTRNSQNPLKIISTARSEAKNS